jgi:hypothetical protein
MISDILKKLRKGRKLVFIPSTIQAAMCGISAVEIYPDNTYIRVYKNGARVSAVMQEDHLNMDENNFNVFKFI